MKRSHGLAGLVVVLLLGGRAPASAATEPEQPPAPAATAEMQAEMHRYFAGERAGGGWLIGVGAATAAVGGGLFAQSGELGRGLAYPLLAVGALELAGGAIFALNTSRRVPRFEQQIGQQPAAFVRTELARIGGVNRDMHRLEIAEVTLMIGSSALAGVGALQQRDLLTGIGLGVLVQSAVLFVYDQLAARRAHRYTDSLLRFRSAIGPS